MKVAAKELSAGDFIAIKGGPAMLHRVPLDRSGPFMASWMTLTREYGEITFDPEEEVELLAKFPERIGR